MSKSGAQTCPRRMQELGPWPRDAGPDTWATGRGLGGRDASGPSCSFCGSLDPDRFMELVRDGWIVGPTDKSYKAYLDKPATEEEKQRKKRNWLAGDLAEAIKLSAEADGKTPEEVADELEATYRASHPMGDSAGTVAKFYFQHLSEEQCREFIDLYNSRQMTVGYPSHFYRWPFFMKPATESGTTEGA